MFPVTVPDIVLSQELLGNSTGRWEVTLKCNALYCVHYSLIGSYCLDIMR